MWVIMFNNCSEMGRFETIEEAVVEVQRLGQNLENQTGEDSDVWFNIEFLPAKSA